MDDSVIMCDEIVEKIKTALTNFNEKNLLQNTKFLYFITFLLITMVLLIAVSIYCYLIKYQAKQRYFLPFHVTNTSQRNFILTI